MEAISVKVTIEPYDNGKAIVVRSGIRSGGNGVARVARPGPRPISLD